MFRTNPNSTRVFNNPTSTKLIKIMETKDAIADVMDSYFANTVTKEVAIDKLKNLQINLTALTS